MPRVPGGMRPPGTRGVISHAFEPNRRFLYLDETEMRFALLGVDDDAMFLAQQIVASPQHELVAVYEPGVRRNDVARVAPRAVYSEAWEALLASSDVDVVIVASPQAIQPDGVNHPLDRIEERLRKLIPTGLALIAIFPPCATSVAYELEILRQDQGARLIPYFAGKEHPAVDQLVELVVAGEQSPVGLVEQVWFERRLTDRRRETVLAQFSRDADWIMRFIGDVQSVSASGGAGADPYAQLSVTLSGSRGLSLRWVVQPASPGESDTITLVGARGKIGWDVSTDETMPIRGLGAVPFLWSALAQPQAELARLLTKFSQPRGLPAWQDACRELDLTDQVAASVRRKRTIELRKDEKPEENAFKGIMAASGCLILLLAFFGLVFMSVWDGVRMSLGDDQTASAEPADSTTSLLWRLWPVYPFLLFLVLQLLLFVAKQPRQVKS